jgi:hypothetical protein
VKGRYPDEPVRPELLIVCGHCRDPKRPDRGRFVERFRHDYDAARWVATAQTPEVRINAEDRPTDGWNDGPDVRSVWFLRCPRCGDQSPVRNERLQAAAWTLVYELSTGGESPRKLPPVTLDELRDRLRAIPEGAARSWPGW